MNVIQEINRINEEEARLGLGAGPNGTDRGGSWVGARPLAGSNLSEPPFVRTLGMYELNHSMWTGLSKLLAWLFW